MSRKVALDIIESVLSEYAKLQINLESDQARKELAKAILAKISARYYMAEYSSQESFE